MSALEKVEFRTSTAANDDHEKLLSKFEDRRSSELVIALAGPIGCGINKVAEELEAQLRARDYVDVVRIKLSKFLEDAISENLVGALPDDTTKSARFRRYRRLQEAGKELRTRTSNPAVLAEYAAKAISLDRLKKDDGKTAAQAVKVPGRVAYIIDQVKRPEEVTLLRALYRNLFYLAGVTRVYDARKEVLLSEQVKSNEVDHLMEIDRKEDGDAGQQLDKTLFLADYFIRNDSRAADDKRAKLARFLNLIHGDQSVTPTTLESGMFAAYGASLRSACLSRQVGAAIASKSGEVIATGCNDVPMAGGGLYGDNPNSSDMRCIHMDDRICFNDVYKRNLQ